MAQGTVRLPRCLPRWQNFSFTTAAWITIHRPALMEGVDNDFRSIFGATSFMTAMCVALDPATGRLRSSAQGTHRFWLFITTAQQNPSLRGASTGLIKRMAFTETTIDLEPGDLSSLYTDGLLRWTKDKRHQVTPGQLEKVLDHSGTHAEAFLKRIVAQTTPDDSCETAPDDVAAIAVRGRTGNKNF